MPETLRLGRKQGCFLVCNESPSRPHSEKNPCVGWWPPRERDQNWWISRLKSSARLSVTCRRNTKSRLGFETGLKFLNHVTHLLLPIPTDKLDREAPLCSGGVRSWDVFYWCILHGVHKLPCCGCQRKWCRSFWTVLRNRTLNKNALQGVLLVYRYWQIVICF